MVATAEMYAIWAASNGCGVVHIMPSTPIGLAPEVNGQLTKASAPVSFIRSALLKYLRWYSAALPIITGRPVSTASVAAPMPA